MIMKLSLLVMTLLVSLVAGLVWTFTVVVMPGIQSLDDRDFLRAFKVMDGVIQNSQPAFVGVWLGSVVMSFATAGLGLIELGGLSGFALLLAAALYILGVQLPTMMVNVPLNNELQRLDLDSLDGVALREARDRFEYRWNYWNVFRTRISVAVTPILLTLLMGI